MKERGFPIAALLLQLPVTVVLTLAAFAPASERRGELNCLLGYTENTITLAFILGVLAGTALTLIAAVLNYANLAPYVMVVIAHVILNVFMVAVIVALSSTHRELCSTAPQSGPLADLRSYALEAICGELQERQLTPEHLGVHCVGKPRLQGAYLFRLTVGLGEGKLGLQANCARNGG